MGRDKEHLSEGQIRVVAARHADGETASSLANRYGYTTAGMRTLLASERCMNYVTAIEDRAVSCRTKILLASDTMIETDIAVALNINDPASQRSRHYLLDKVLPTIHRVEQKTETNHAISGELGTELGGLLKDLRTSLALGPSHEQTQITLNGRILEGEAALPRPVSDAQQPTPPLEAPDDSPREPDSPNDG